MVLITSEYVICASAGDCRAVLARAPVSLAPPPPPTPATPTQISTIPESPASASTAAAGIVDYVTVELSKDHKPDIPVWKSLVD